MKRLIITILILISIAIFIAVLLTPIIDKCLSRHYFRELCASIGGEYGELGGHNTTTGEYIEPNIYCDLSGNVRITTK